MVDEFGQKVRGIHQAGDAIIAEDTHIAVFGKDPSDQYEYLSIDANGRLEVTGGAQYDVDDAAGATDTGTLALVVRTDTPSTLTPADGDYTWLQVDSTGQLWITATDLDIRDLDANQDNVAISDGTNTLAVNGDGSINVVSSGSASDSVYVHGSANLVKGTQTDVVSLAPGADEQISAVMVSGAGYCEWTVEFGVTSSEAVILQFWTTPSTPTQYIDLPDYLTVSSGETIKVTGTNRSLRPTPGSDFTGYASIIRKA